MSDAEILVEASGVRHSFGEDALRKEILHGVSCKIHAREIVIVTGPSGSGKTTFLTLIGALRSIQDGSIRLLGKELRGASPEDLVIARRAVGFVFQQHHLIPALSARENVQIPLAYDASLTPDAVRGRAMQLLTAVGMSEHADKKPAQLSGGQRQRVAIARALVGRPRIILADEPTSSLDSVSGREIVKILEALARQENCAVILVTHDSRILDVADRILHLEDGELEESDLRFERVWADLGAMTSNIAGYLGSVRPGQEIPPILPERRREFLELHARTQHGLLQLKQFGTVHSATELGAMQRLLGEMESLSDAVENLASWYLQHQGGDNEFEAVEAMLQILRDGVSARNTDTLLLVAASTRRGNAFLERLMDRPGESAEERIELLALVAPILFIVRSVAEKVADARSA